MKEQVAQELLDSQDSQPIIKKCEHVNLSAREDYLTTCYTPHVQDTDTLAVSVNLFLCRDCKETVSLKHVVPRGFLGDGSISPTMQTEISKIRTDQIVEARVRAVEREKGATPDA